jgi:hypothetical protein
MIKLEVTAESPEEMWQQMVGLGRLANECVIKPLFSPPAAPVATEAAVEPVAQESAPVVEEKPKRTRRKKESTTEVVEPSATEVVEESTTKAAEEPEYEDAEPAAAGTEVSVVDMKAALVKAKERVGMDRVRVLLSEFGGMLADIPQSSYPELLVRVNELE